MKHILDWYNENTPQNEDEYEKGCLTSAAIIAIIFIALTVEGNPYTFYNSQYIMSEDIHATSNLASEYILEMWLVGDLGIFEDKELAAIRIYTNQGYEDIKLGKRIAKLKELYSVYKSAL